jgi:serine/threonine protein phosphatase 1
LKSLENYHLDEQRRLYVHAGFTNVNGVDYEYFPGLFYWDRTLWETALALDKTMATDNIFYPKRLLYM